MNKQRGVTLIELIVAMAIITISLFIGLPNLMTLSKNSELINQSNQFATLMSYARSEATKRQSPVRICRSSDNATCANNGSNLIVLNSDNNLLRTTTLNTNINYYFQNLTSNTITFNALGVPNDVGEIVLCDDRGSSYAKGIALNMGGQVRALVKSEISNISCS